MKKKIVASVLAGIIVVAVLTACGSSVSPADVAGKYTMTGMENGGVLKEGDELKAMLDTMGYTPNDSYIKLDGDGTFTMNLMGTEMTGSFKVSGTKLTVTPTTEKVTAKKYTINGNKITVGDSSSQIIFEK
jgi:hypothetical protein